MILSDREIRAAIARGALTITPDPPADAWSSTAVDLTLAKELVLWKRPGGAGVEAVVCPAHKSTTSRPSASSTRSRSKLATRATFSSPGRSCSDGPGKKIKLPHRSRIAARVEGKSSLARLGIGVHVTAPTIHAGFGYKKDDEGFAGSPLQLEMWNAGPLDVKLNAGMRICQLIFEVVDGTPEKGYEGRFSVQGPGA
jgi:dCTP deaminase